MDRDFLRVVMVSKGCGMLELARACKISRSALYRKISGKTAFTVREADIVARTLAMTAEEMTRIFFAHSVS